MTNTVNIVNNINKHLNMLLSRSNKTKRNNKNKNAPLALTNRNRPLALTNGNRPLALTNGNRPLALTNGNRPLALTNGNRPLALTNGNRPLALTNGNRPLALTNGNRPLALTNGNRPLALTNENRPQLLKNTNKPLNNTNIQKKNQANKNKPVSSGDCVKEFGDRKTLRKAMFSMGENGKLSDPARFRRMTNCWQKKGNNNSRKWVKYTNGPNTYYVNKVKPESVWQIPPGDILNAKTPTHFIVGESDNWNKLEDENGITYYYDKQSQKSNWNAPSGVVFKPVRKQQTNIEGPKPNTIKPIENIRT